MKALFVLLCGTGLLSPAFANPLGIRCRAGGDECAPRIQTALTKLGCKLLGPAECKAIPEDPGPFYCEVETENCESPAADMMFTTHCTYGYKRGLTDQDRLLTLDWSMSFFEIYVKDVCVR